MQPNKNIFQPPPAKVYEVPEDEVPPDQQTVLLLDDDAEFASTMKEFLQSKGMKVTVVSSGVEGIKHVMASDFDAILCDMMMPKMPGDMFYLAVERTKPHLTKRFIFMTGHQGNPKIDQFIRGIRGLMLWKPFDFQQLTDALAIIRKKQAKGR